MFRIRQFYPDKIILTANVTDENLQAAMDYLLSGNAEAGCKILLNDNHISVEQIDILLKALADDRCPPRIEIALNNCHLTNLHAEKFAALFADGRYPADMRVHLPGNSIGDHGFSAMIRALSRDINRPGVYLNMQVNHHLSDASCNALANLISTNQLADGVGFDLQNNPALSKNSLQKLAKSLEKNTAVTELTMKLYTDEMMDEAFDNRDFGLLNDYTGKDAALKFCCERNQLLQKYRENPDFIYQIYRLSESRGMPLPYPAAEENLVPSLRFFSVKAMPPTALQTFLDRHPDTFEKLRALEEGMQNNANQLDPDSKKRGYPWSCTLL